MKKIFSVVVLFAIMILTVFGCGGSAKHFTGEWKFSKITKVECSSDFTQSDLDDFKEFYDVETKEDVAQIIMDTLVEGEIYKSYYIKFDGKKAYTLDPLMEREATWAFYQTGDNTGFISYDTQLDASAGNPAPEVFPGISYLADSDTLVIVERYSVYMVTIELKR